MATSQQLGERSATERAPTWNREAVLDEARRSVARTAALLVAHQEALDALRTSRAIHERLRGSATTAGNGRDEPAPPEDLLTPRQLEILGYLADGLNTARIAERLWLSPATVRNHVSAILGALGCHSRIEAVARARRLGLL